MKFDCGGGGGACIGLRLQRSFVKIGRVAGCEILEMGKANRLGGDIAKCRVREPFLAKSFDGRNPRNPHLTSPG